MTVRTRALRLRNAALVGHPLQVRRQLRAAVRMRSLGTALLGLLLLRLRRRRCPLVSSTSLSGLVSPNGSSICRRRSVSLGGRLRRAASSRLCNSVFKSRMLASSAKMDAIRIANAPCAICSRMKRFTSARSGSTSLVMRSTLRACADIQPRQRRARTSKFHAPELGVVLFYAAMATRGPALATRGVRQVDAFEHQE